MPDLNASLDRFCYIVVKAREYSAMVPSPAGDEASNPSDDRMLEVLEDTSGNPTVQELVAAINSLNEEAQLELLALAWTGRGDYAAEQWEEALAQARDVRDRHLVRYLLGMPLLGDVLEEGLSQLGYSCIDTETGRL